MKKDKYRVKIEKIAKKGFKGYPIATIAYYGPDDKKASKVAVGILEAKDKDVTQLERFFSETIDIRINSLINKQIYKFIKKHRAQSIVIMERIIGCPHEQGVDYPLGEKCPLCQFWADKDRWTGKKLKEE